MDNMSSMEDFRRNRELAREAHYEQFELELGVLIEDLDENTHAIGESADEISAIVLAILFDADWDAPPSAGDLPSTMYRPIRDADGKLGGYRVINPDLQRGIAEMLCRVEALQQTEAGTTLDVEVLRQHDNTLPPQQVWMLARDRSDPESRVIRALMEEPADSQEAPWVIQLDRPR